MQYPKITQETIEQVTYILMESGKNSKYLEYSPYSDKARVKIKDCLSSLQTVRFEETFDDNDTWGVIKSLSLGIREMEKLAESADSESARLNAVKGLFDMNQKKVDLLEKVVGMIKVSQIESLCKQYFREIPKTVREEEAQRFQAMLEKLN